MIYPDRINIEASVLLLRTLANPARLRVMLRLLDGECAVATLENELGIRQPNLSQHLAELRDAGLVSTRRDSRMIIYSVAGDEQRHLLTALLHGFGGEAGTPPPSAMSRRPHQAAVFARLVVA